MTHFGNNAFLESNEKVQRIAQISIQELMPHFVNNMAILGNNLVSPLSINLGPFLPFHPFHFLFSHSS
jgi:hypothetical protein